MWLPSTFHDTHTGSSATWYAPKRNAPTARIDYCAVSMSISQAKVESSVSEDIDLAIEVISNVIQNSLWDRPKYKKRKFVT